MFATFYPFTHVCAKGFYILATLSNNCTGILWRKKKVFLRNNWSIGKKRQQRGPTSNAAHCVNGSLLCSEAARAAPPSRLRCENVWRPAPRPCPQQGVYLRQKTIQVKSEPGSHSEQGIHRLQQTSWVKTLTPLCRVWQFPILAPH